MTKQFWINLPVKDLAASKTFFKEIGFSFNPGPGETDVSACLLMGESNVVVMLFAETTFAHFTANALTNTQEGTEVLFSLDAESREEVDAMAEKVSAAGGRVFSEPQEIQGWMYGFGFVDLDGHRWNVIYMDMEKIPAM